jgi:hypothetical protein
VARRQLAQVPVRVREHGGARVALFEQRPDRGDGDAALGAEDRSATDAWWPCVGESQRRGEGRVGLRRAALLDRGEVAVL